MTIYFGCDIPADLYFHPEYDSWVRFEEDGTATMGMTDVAQTLAGKLLFIKFKEPGKVIKFGKIAATIESGKWIGPFVMPFDAEIIESNKKGFEKDILLANKDPYGDGWLYKVKVDDPEEQKKKLLTGNAAVEFYKKKIEDNQIRCYRCVD